MANAASRTPAGIRPELDRLPSGRHGLTREVVVASQRGRLIDAMAGAVAEKGYAATTVADIVERAGVSRRTFYEQFPDLESCFLAAYDIGAELMFGRIRTALDALPEEADWRTRGRTTIGTFLHVLAAEPNFAWALLVESLGAGLESLARHDGLIGLGAQLWRGLNERARGEDATLPELPDDVFVALSGGFEQIVRECLRTRGATALPDLAEPMMRAVVAIFGARGGRPAARGRGRS